MKDTKISLTCVWTASVQKLHNPIDTIECTWEPIYRKNDLADITCSSNIKIKLETK